MSCQAPPLPPRYVLVPSPPNKLPSSTTYPFTSPDLESPLLARPLYFTTFMCVRSFQLVKYRLNAYVSRHCQKRHLEPMFVHPASGPSWLFLFPKGKDGVQVSINLGHHPRRLCRYRNRHWFGVCSCGGDDRWSHDGGAAEEKGCRSVETGGRSWI